MDYTTESIESPFKELRFHHNLTQKELGKLAGVTTQVVLLNEVGCYNLPNPKICELFESLGGEFGSDDKIKLLNSYQDFRRHARDQALSEVPNPGNPFLRPPTSPVGPEGSFVGASNLLSGRPATPGFVNIEDLQRWVKFKRQFATSTVGFCKRVAIQPSLINTFESSLYSRNWQAIRMWLWPGG